MNLVKPPSKLSCFVCKQPISGGRTVIDGFWHCSDCTYKHDHPDKPIPEPTKPKAYRKTDARLFDIQ